MTIEAAAERFLAAAGISDGTRRGYRADLEEFARWFGPDSPVEDVDVRVLADWVTELGRSRPGGRRWRTPGCRSSPTWSPTS